MRVVLSESSKREEEKNDDIRAQPGFRHKILILSPNSSKEMS